MNLHEINVNGCRLPLTVCGGNTQLHMGRLAVRAQINREGCLELGICGNHTSLPISFLQLSLQFSLLQNTYLSVSEFHDFHSSNLENICVSQFSFLAGEGCITAIPRHFTWLQTAAGLGMELWTLVLQFVQVLYCRWSSALYPHLYSEKHLTYIQF